MARLSEGWLAILMHLSLVCPRMGGSGNPGELDFVQRTWVGILTSTTIPGVGNLTRPPSWKVERIWEWVTSDAPSWKIPRIHLSKFWLNERYKRVLCCFLSKNVVFMPISALSLNFYNTRYFSFSFEKIRSFKSSIRSKFTSYLHAFIRFRPAKVFDIRYVDLLVYSKWTSATNISWMKAAYVLFLVWHSNESRNLTKSHQTMICGVFNNNLTFRDTSVLIF